jgi:hypothetical protein
MRVVFGKLSTRTHMFRVLMLLLLLLPLPLLLLLLQRSHS